MIENKSKANVEQNAEKAERPAVGVETNVRPNVEHIIKKKPPGIA